MAVDSPSDHSIDSAAPPAGAPVSPIRAAVLKADQSPFRSPSGISSPFVTNRSASPQGSPFKSPRRGIIKLEYQNDRIAFSPVKTPNGRAGQISPRRRVAALNKSARKRAVKTSSVYARLMREDEDEDEDEEDDVLKQQDIRIAESILRQSRDGDFRAYGSDVELEEDLTSKTKRRRTAVRPKIEPEPLAEDEPDLDLDIDDSSDEFNEVEEEEEDDEDDGLDSSDEEVVMPSPTKSRSRKSPGKSRSPPTDLELEEVIEIQSPTKQPGEKRKVGRPTKAEKIIGSIKSIFQMDDENIFKENKSKPKTSTKQKEEPNSNISSKLDVDIVPTISGLAPKNTTEVPQEAIKEFVPLQIPKTDAKGNIIDEEFLEVHFGGVRLEENLKGRFLDERAFFLEGSEGYFEQHSTRAKPSNRSLAQLAPSVEYDSFIPYIESMDRIAQSEKHSLYGLQKLLYPQWCFELSQGFSLNFYGIGSKIDLILDFATNYFVEWFEEKYEFDIPQIMVVNGYNPTIKFKKILQDIVTVFIPPEKKKKESIRFPKHVAETVPFLINYIEKQRKLTYNTSDENSFIVPKMILVINNIDGEVFRDERTQNYFSILASLPEIWLVSSTDNVNAPLLWDQSKMKSFNFLWHDLTTYKSYSTELSFKDVLNLGKSKKFIGDKGVQFVLNSLTANAKNTYRTLLEMQIMIINEVAGTETARSSLKGNIKNGVSFKGLYDNCLEKFITSNEITFRTVLGEFIEHKMCKLVKNDAGSEIVFVPFSYDEMVKVMKDVFEIDVSDPI